MSGFALSLPLGALPLHLEMFYGTLRYYLQPHMAGMVGCICDEVAGLSQ